MLLALVVGGMTLTLGIVNIIPLEVPAWVYAELPLYSVVAWFTGRLEVRRRASL
jgi:hypothetical protein